METYFSVSRYGAFLFRTDIISNSAAEAAKVQQVLRSAFKDSDGYEVTPERPAFCVDCHGACVMLYTLKLKLEAYHKPTETWKVYHANHGVRAVSRKHALKKGLHIVTTQWPGYVDREGHPDWTVEASVTFVEAV